jgi:hypothetical protein
VVGEKVRITHRLTSILKTYVPQVRPWLQDKATRLCCDFLSRWPTLKAAPLARRSTLETFFRAHHVRSADMVAQRLHAIKTAIPLTTDEGVSAPNALHVQVLVHQLRVTWEAIETFDHAIAPRAQNHPDCPLFQARPGAGPVFASRLLVAFGEQRERYASAAARQKYAGIAPVTERSGKKSWVHWRLEWPMFLRHTFVEWAAESVRHAFWARVYDQQQRDQGKAHQAAVRALACKWIRILFRCWQERTLDDESVSLNALTSRGSSLIHNLAKRSPATP